MERIERFVALVHVWNRRINLVGRADLETIWHRHVVDSLQLAAHLPPNADRFADLGSGAGFPGLVLAIVSDRHVHLIESDLRKAAFLQEAARLTATSATVHARRIEAMRDFRVPAVTARALAPLRTLLEWAYPLIEPNGVCIFPKGRTVDRELDLAGQQWRMTVCRTPSVTERDGCVLAIRDMRPTRQP